MDKWIFEFLQPLGNVDMYATPCLYATITGIELLEVRDNPTELAELILSKLKEAYDSQVKNVNEWLDNEG